MEAQGEQRRQTNDQFDHLAHSTYAKTDADFAEVQMKVDPRRNTSEVQLSGLFHKLRKC